MRTVTPLAGEEKKSQQFPITLGYFGITGFETYVNDSDVDIYLVRTTGNASLTPVTGYTRFEPAATFSTPSLSWAHDAVSTEMSVTLSNIDGAWTSALLNGTYRNSPVEVWQVNLVIDVVDLPEQATVTAGVLVFSGLLDFLAVDASTATLRVLPSYVSPHNTQLPRRRFTSERFKFLPEPNTVLSWGFTEVTL